MKTQFQSNFASQSRLMQCSLRRSRADARSGFTVIELIVVVMVIAILAAMLLPAISGARNTARNAQVTVDIKNLEAAIATFKQKFGVEPPSSFKIYESGVWPVTNPLDKESVAVIRAIWPDANFTKVIPNSPNSPLKLDYFPIDLNVNGAMNDEFVLNGAECLVFFLGGPGMLYDTSVTDGLKNVIPNGFSANPANPFASGGARVGPFYEFNLSRLSDIAPANGCPELLDPLPNQTMPYQYFSSYGGRVYPLNINVTLSLDDDEIAQIPDVVRSTPQFKTVYFQSARPVDPSDLTKGYTLGYWNPKGYQIISPGRDGEYGSGGGYRDGKFINLNGSDRGANAKAERDNITNFSSGPLQP